MSQIEIANITNTSKTTEQNTIVKLKWLELIIRLISNKTKYLELQMIMGYNIS